MALEVKTAKRVFIWNTKEIEDPAPHLSPDEVRKLLSATNIEMVTANVGLPKVEQREEGPVSLYRIEKKAGTLG